MSIFPRTDPARRRLPESAHDAGIEAEGRLARPINGFIYLIEETDLAPLMGRRPLRSGLVSRH